MPNPIHHDLVTAQVLLQHFFPDRRELPSDQVQDLLNTAGLWALTTHLAAPPEHSELLGRLGQRLNGLSFAATPPQAPGPPSNAHIQQVRARCQTLHMPFVLGGQIPEALRHLSFRTHPKILDTAIATLPAGIQHTELQVTLVLAYLSWPEVQSRVQRVLRLRYTRNAQVQQDKDASRIATVLEAHHLPWPGRTTLRGSVKQVAMRVSRTLAGEVQASLRTLKVTQLDLHTTLLALYLADSALQDQVLALLADRQNTTP